MAWSDAARAAAVAARRAKAQGRRKANQLPPAPNMTIGEQLNAMTPEQREQVYAKAKFLRPGAYGSKPTVAQSAAKHERRSGGIR